MSEDLKAIAVMVALRKALQDSKHFSICTIDNAIAALGVVPDKEAYTTLRVLHCVDYMDMPRELRQSLPGLVAKCTFLADPVPAIGGAIRPALEMSTAGAQLKLVKVGP
jgi:hypothetical protein